MSERGGKKNMCNAMTVDVEAWFQTVLFERNQRAHVGNLVQNVTEIMLILDEFGVKATFFVSGVVAERAPEIVAQISSRGHEIASHGYRHALVYKMSPQEFADDVGRSMDILKGITGVRVMGYRAPTWSIFRNMDWAISALKGLGLKYDSSIYPVSRNIFKCPALPTAPYLITDGLVEFPPPVFKCLGYNMPFAGGTFLRFFPEELISRKFLEINALGQPALAYFHSWEFDDILPEAGMSYWKRWVQYGNVRSVRVKLRAMLNKFKFTSMRAVLQEARLIVA
ncbi:MAG: DUF3473 domain-containing protein [Candidatus Omnitrophica bacterium]|nr:DUF3473 domain-containing protein [Candidatus Omnitrophota bacterium]